MKGISGRVAIVTGGASGIGEAIAKELVRAGAFVWIADINIAAAEALAKSVGSSRALHLDVTSPESIAAAVANLQGLDILVNNAGIVEAGITPREVFPELEPARWLRVVDVNVRGVLFGTQHAIAAMRNSGGGVIINIASMAGIGVGPHPAPVYAASKAAVVRFTAALAPLGRRLNIRVNCICPDWVDTPMVQRTRAAVSAEEWRAIAPSVMTQPEEIADAVVTMITDDSLAGRVMLCVGPKPWPLMEPTKPPK